MSHLRYQLQVELFEQAGEFIPKQIVCLAQAALLVEWGVLEVAHLHADAARDVVSDGLQPTHLLPGEGAAGVLPIGLIPWLGLTLVHTISDWIEQLLLSHWKPGSSKTIVIFTMCLPGPEELRSVPGCTHA